MKVFTAALSLAVAALLAGVATSAGAAPTSESYRTDGLIAVGQWGEQGEEPPVGVPRAIFVQGADAIETIRTAGSKPIRREQQSGVAFAVMLVDDNGDSYPAEVWGLTDEADFTITPDLTEASLAFDCEAEILIWDPELAEEVPSGETIALSVVAHWTGVGNLATSKNHSKYSEDGLFTIELGRRTSRPATVELTLTGPEGVLFDGTMDYGEMSDVTQASMMHMR